MWNPALSSKTNFPFQSLEAILDRKFLREGLMNEARGGWMRIRMIPSVSEQGSVRKSLSWEMMTAFSFWAVEINSRSFVPEGIRAMLWPNARGEELFGFIESDVFGVFGDLGGVVQSGADMVAGQGGGMAQDFLIARRPDRA